MEEEEEERPKRPESLAFVISWQWKGDCERPMNSMEAQMPSGKPERRSGIRVIALLGKDRKEGA